MSRRRMAKQFFIIERYPDSMGGRLCHALTDRLVTPEQNFRPGLAFEYRECGFPKKRLKGKRLASCWRCLREFPDGTSGRIP
jgi:hypothetical protein